jgi:hypothetical protein
MLIHHSHLLHIRAEADAGAQPISNEPKPRILLMGLRR